MDIYSLKTENILFLDIETVPEYAQYEQMPDDMKKLWDLKAKYLHKEDEEHGAPGLYGRAGIYAEFGKIICISVGMIYNNQGQPCLRLKTYYGADEVSILEGFKAMIENFGKKHDVVLAAHNGKEFDFPYMARRMLINNIKLPPVLQLSGKKPWETPFIDTMELWKFGDYKHYTSLALLTRVLGIPTPKDDLDGSMVAGVYYIDKDMERIVTYCEKDVVAVAQVFLRFRQEPLILEENIQSVT